MMVGLLKYTEERYHRVFMSLEREVFPINFLPEDILEMKVHTNKILLIGKEDEERKDVLLRDQGFAFYTVFILE